MTPSSTNQRRMTREEYREVYLRSDHWRQARQAALERAEHRCQVCNRAERLDVHHRTYERLGAERPADLTVLCRRCHDLFHQKGKKLAPAQHARNWSTLPAPERTEVEMRCLRSLVTEGPAKTKTIAANVGERAQVVGSCFVALRRQRLVKKAKNGMWSATTTGIAMSGVSPKPLVWPSKAPARGRMAKLETDNEQLHAIQSANKLKQRLVREGQVSTSLRSDLAGRHRI